MNQLIILSINQRVFILKIRRYQVFLIKQPKVEPLRPRMTTRTHKPRRGCIERMMSPNMQPSRPFSKLHNGPKRCTALRMRKVLGRDNAIAEQGITTLSDIQARVELYFANERGLERGREKKKKKKPFGDISDLGNSC